MVEESIREQVKRVARPIFNKFLQEGNLGSMALHKMLFRPNNYRRKCHVFINDLKKESTSQLLQSALFKGELESVRCSSKNKLIFIKFNNHVNLQLGKSSIVGVYNQLKNNKKVVFEIVGDTDDELAEVIENKSNEIKELIDNTIKEFCNKYQIEFNPVIEWERQEAWLKGDEFIDKLPKDMILHDTIFKKVYGEGLEFKSGKNEDASVHVKNYIKNRSVDLPKIETKLDTFNDKFNKILTIQEKQAENILFLAQNVNTHIPMIKKLGEAADRLQEEVHNLNKSSWFEDL